jgi:VanZ family protein
MNRGRLAWRSDVAVIVVAMIGGCYALVEGPWRAIYRARNRLVVEPALITRFSDAADVMNTIFKLIAAVAWASVAVIAYATLTHAAFVYAVYDRLSPLLMRPELGTYVHLEHIVAFALMGALFGLAYPRHLLLVCGFVMGAAVLLELLQTLTPDRHGTLVDALEKIAGGGLGVGLAKAVASRLTAING